MAGARKIQVGASEARERAGVTALDGQDAAIELPVLEAGQGGRPLLLAHGFTGAGVDFADHLDDLAAAGWHAVAPTHRGHLGSAAPPEESDYSLDIIASDLLGLADALGWDRFALLGHSMGGMVAQVLAARSPERVDALVLMDTGHGPVAVDADLAAAGVAVARESGMDVLADILATRPSPLETAASVRLREERPDLKALDDRKLRGAAPPMYAAMIVEMLGSGDRLDSLRFLPMPTLVLVGEQDTPFRDASERMAEAIPGSRLVVLADAGHSPQVETPEAWSREVLGFLQETVDAALPVAGG